MISIDQQLAGIWRFIDENPKRVGKAKIKRWTREVQERTLMDWASGNLHSAYGIEERFKRRAFDTLKLSQRSKSYRAQQTRFYGAPLPFRSPRNKIHTAETATIPGFGYKTGTAPGARDGIVSTRLTLPGARHLNRLPQKYRQEFLGLNANDARSGEAINTATQTRVFRRLRNEISALKPKKKRARRGR